MSDYSFVNLASKGDGDDEEARGTNDFQTDVGASVTTFEMAQRAASAGGG